MRRSTLTVGLGAVAVAAIAVAPRLSGWTAPPPVVTSEVVVVPAERIPAEVVLQLQTPPTPPPQVVPEVTALPPLTVRPPTAHAIEMKTSASPQSAIPELGSPRPIPHVKIPQVRPPVEPEPIEIDVGFWDDCPTCGMG